MNCEINPPASPSKAVEIADQLRDRLFSCHHEDRTPVLSDMEYMVDRIDRLASLAACEVVNVETESDPMQSDWPLDRAIEMLTAYAELVKATGRYAEEHYIPEVEHVISELRDAIDRASAGEAQS